MTFPGVPRDIVRSLSLSPVLNCATWKEVPREIRQLYLQVCNSDYIYIYVYEYNCHLRSGRNISSCRLEPGDSNLEMKWEGFWLKQITAAVSQAKVARRPWIGRSLSLSEWLRQMQTGTRDKGRWETMGLKGRNTSPGPAALTSCGRPLPQAVLHAYPWFQA